MIKILLAGEGGQGIQTVAKIIARAARKSGQHTSYIPSFGIEQRGGVSLAFVQMDEEPISYHRFEKANLIVAFCNRAINIVKDYLKEDSLFIYDNSEIYNHYLKELDGKVKKSIQIPARQLAQEDFKNTKVLNMILMGSVLAQIPEIKDEFIEEIFVDELKSKIAKNPEIKEQNLSAINKGFKLAQNRDLTEPLSGVEPHEIQQEFSDDKKTWTRFPEQCKGCALCVVRCPVKAIKFTQEVGFLGNPLPIVDINKCIACELCEKTCPDGAIKLDKK